MILALQITTGYYLALSAALFCLGAVGLLVRRNPLIMFMCVELMLNAVNISFVALGDQGNYKISWRRSFCFSKRWALFH